MEAIKKEDNGLMTNDLVWAKVKPNAIIPTKDEENAGYDIYACFDEDYMIIPEHSTRLIPTGIASAMCDNWYLNVAERGSTGSKGMKYSAGIIDSSYRGEIFIAISNVNRCPIIISKLDKDELLNKYGLESLLFKEIPYDINNPSVDDLRNALFDQDDFVFEEPIIYPYSKAIAQLIVHEVPKMNTYEISYEELLKIPSKRGTGALGSSNK